MRPDPRQHVDVRWMTAFIDVPASGHAAAARFWCGVAGSRLSEPRGGTGQFATFLPADGDAYLRLQRIDAWRPGIHLDLHVDDVAELASYATSLGAAGSISDEGVFVMRSPGGLPFCIVSHGGERVRPSPVRSETGTDSVVDQVCLDITPARYAAELAFWAALTGWPARGTDAPEFHRLDPPPHQPLRFLLQRLDSPSDARTTAHLDLACDSVPHETARHEALGAEVVAAHEGWTTMRDPAGARYCLTARAPT
jgi:hypothetical protein